MANKRKEIEVYALKPCKICNEMIEPYNNRGKPYSEMVYLGCNTCTSSWCRTEWKRQIKSETKIFNPPLDLIDYFNFGMQAEYRQMLALQITQPIQYNVPLKLVKTKRI